MNTTTLRPGLLVSLKTSIVGNTTYRRLEIEPDHLVDTGERLAKWETERMIADPAEWSRATQMRSQCAIAVRRVCAPSTFGLLCPEDKRDELDAAIQKAQSLAAEFNATAARTRIAVYVITGRIAQDDVQAVRAINSEVSSLMTRMEQGLKNLDVKTVRAAANDAKSIGRMLSPEAAERIKTAVDAAREMARKIVKAGEEAAVAIDAAVIRKITESRTMFLDLSDEPLADVQAPAATARAIDLEPELPFAAAPKQRPQAPQLEV